MKIKARWQNGNLYFKNFVVIKESLVSFFKIRCLDKVIGVFAVITRLEKGRGERMLDRMTYKTEFHMCRL